MTIEEIASVIEQSTKRQIERHTDPDWETYHDRRDVVINLASQLIDLELSEAEDIIYEIGKEEFGVDENNPDRPPVYERLNAVDEHLNALRKIAEIRRYLQVKNFAEFIGVFRP
jgi:hypothetical protein